MLAENMSFPRWTLPLLSAAGALLLVTAVQAQEQQPQAAEQEKKVQPDRSGKVMSISPTREGLQQQPAPTPQPSVPAATTGKGDGSGPSVEFPQPKHDFGEVWIGTKLDHTFEIRNTGSSLLQILSVKPSCGCTLAGQYDKTIPPGGSGKIPITMDSKKLNGKFAKTVRISTNDATNANTTLTVSGTVKHYVTTEPRTVNFGTLKPREEKTQKVKLKNNSDQPLQLTLSPGVVGDGFAAELVEQEPGQEYELLIHSKPPYKEGRNLGKVLLKTNLTQQPDMTIRMLARVLARLEVNPPQLVISKAQPNETTRSINVSNHGNAPVHLLSASVDDDKLTLETKEVEPGVKYSVKVNIPANYKPDRAGKTITLNLDDAEKPVITVPVRSSSRPPRPAEQLVDKQAPKVVFTTNSDTNIDTANIKDEALVLKFYATWCGFCKKSLPNMEKIYQEYKDKGVRFVNVNLDNPEDPRQNRRFTKEQALAKLTELGVTHEVAFDPDKKIGTAFKVQSFPTMFVLDKSGTVKNVNVGAIQGSRVDLLKKQLDSILAAQTAKANGRTAAPSTSGTH